MCTCYRNWQADDCSERTCPFSYAFVTTPQGDLNMDGDRLDNSFKPLSQTISSLPMLSNQVIFTAALQAGEIAPGDGIWIEGQSFIVATHTSGSASLTLETVHSTGIQQTAPTAYRFLESIPRPAGTWESWPGDYAAQDEAHYYMECSNRGLCDRKTGICKCFAGYTGHACARTTCPNDCSGHGTCEYVSELRMQQPKKITTCTVEGIRGSKTLTTSQDCQTGLAVGDLLIVGDAKVANKIAALSATAFTLTDPLPKEFAYGTPIALQAQYKLWDADKNRACVCDSRYEGYDCSELKCPRGDDPLTTDQIWETQVVNIGGSNPENAISGSFKLIFTDMYGAMWKTTGIEVAASFDNSAGVKAALKALPNDVIQDISVTSLPVSTTGVRYQIKFDGGLLATANGNSGDLPLMGCDTSALSVLLETDVGYAGNGLSYPTATALAKTGGGTVLATTDGTSTTVTLDAGIDTGVTALIDGDVVVIGTESRVVAGNWGTIANNAASFKVDRPFSAATTQAITRAGASGSGDSTKTLTFNTGQALPAASTIVVGDLIAIGTEQRKVTSLTPTNGAATIDSVEIESPFTTVSGSGNVQLKIARFIKGGVECTVTDISPMMPASWNAAYVTGSVATGGAALDSQTVTATSDGTSTTLTLTTNAYRTVAGGGTIDMQDGDTLKIGTELRLLKGNGGTIATGATSVKVNAPFSAVTDATILYLSGDKTRELTLSAAVDANTLSVGDKILIKQNGASAAEQTVTVTKITSAVIETKEMMGVHLASSAVYRSGKGTKENAVCSNRGLCDSGTGVCTCFKGYTFNDCSRQNALAL